MNKETAILTLKELGNKNEKLLKYTNKLVVELSKPEKVTELEKIKALFPSGSIGEFLTNSLILTVKQDNISVKVITTEDIIEDDEEEEEVKEVEEEDDNEDESDNEDKPLITL